MTLSDRGRIKDVPTLCKEFYERYAEDVSRACMALEAANITCVTPGPAGAHGRDVNQTPASDVLQLIFATLADPQKVVSEQAMKGFCEPTRMRHYLQQMTDGQSTKGFRSPGLREAVENKPANATLRQGNEALNTVFDKWIKKEGLRFYLDAIQRSGQPDTATPLWLHRAADFSVTPTPHGPASK